MKVFLSIGNEKIEEELKSIKEIDIVDSESDLETLKNLIEVINIEYLIVNRLLSDDGQELVEIARLAKKRHVKVIMLINQLDDFKEKKLITSLVNEDVYAFVSLEDDIVDKVKEVIKDYPKEFNFVSLVAEEEQKKTKSEPIIVERTIKQQIITFYTTDNALYTADLITQLSVLLAQKSQQKILVIDLNSMLPVMDHYYGIKKEIDLQDVYESKEITSLAAIYNAIENNIFCADLLDDLVIKHPKYKNLDIITGLYDLGMYETLDKKHYKMLIDVAADKYDTIFINTNPGITVTATYVALMKATKIIAITDANYTYSRNLYFILRNLNTYQKISKDKFKIVVNNVSSQSLNNDAMRKIFKEYEILGLIPSNNKKDLFLNSKKPFITSAVAKKDVLNYLDIIEKLGYIPKTSFMDKFKNRKKIIREICTEQGEE